jgi:protein SCO1
MLRTAEVDQDSTEESIVALVDAVRRDPRHRGSLVALLPERNSLYTGRSTNATIRIRGYIIASFEQVGLTAEALPYVLEELENGRDAYLVAAAAIAFRGLDKPASDAVPYLLKAIENIKYCDDSVSFESYRAHWPDASHTTAIEEIMKTFAWLGPHARSAVPALRTLYAEPEAISPTARTILEGILADLNATVGDHGSMVEDGCCCAMPAGPAEERQNTPVPTDILMQDQDGRDLTFGEFFTGKPSVVAFFYTRCDNPNKCSLTVTKIAGLQRALREEGLHGQVRVAAITYDPNYDLAPRMQAYGENRGVVFGESDRFLRTKGGFETIRDYFELGVNFGQALVNRHRIELFILDADAKIASTFTRLQWDIQTVLDEACTHLTRSNG